jgi:hypothetical protein
MHPSADRHPIKAAASVIWLSVLWPVTGSSCQRQSKEEVLVKGRSSCQKEEVLVTCSEEIGEISSCRSEEIGEISSRCSEEIGEISSRCSEEIGEISSRCSEEISSIFLFLIWRKGGS